MCMCVNMYVCVHVKIMHTGLHTVLYIVPMTSLSVDLSCFSSAGLVCAINRIHKN